MDHAMLIETTTGLAIGTATTVWRVAAAAAMSPQGVCTDDYIMIFATVLWWLGSACFAYAGATYHFTNAGWSDAERLSMTPEGDLHELGYAAKKGSIVMLVGWELVICFVWSLKLSVLFFYARLIGKNTRMRRPLQVATLYWATCFAVTVLFHHLSCVPIERNWQVFPDPGDACQPAAALVNNYVFNILDGVMDLILIAVALLFIRRAMLDLNRKHELFLSAIFSLSIIVVVLEAMLLYSLQTKQADAGNPGNIWRTRRSYSAVILTNLPSLYPSILNFARYIRQVFRSLFSRSSNESEVSATPPQIDLDMLNGHAVVRNSTAGSQSSGRTESERATATHGTQDSRKASVDNV
ncbi:hypothetical protein JOL62DRAFT_338226 [Phyllosticta paracitricarpa]|uniref:Rhodopsin domain-containing protein n=1 Tax=Phyllosticta paracitricarpa TaxID=2016321 RepID=A0ABR1MXD4_9PEZI